MMGSGMLQHNLKLRHGSCQFTDTLSSIGHSRTGLCLVKADGFCLIAPPTSNGSISWGLSRPCRGRVLAFARARSKGQQQNPAKLTNKAIETLKKSLDLSPPAPSVSEAAGLEDVVTKEAASAGHTGGKTVVSSRKRKAAFSSQQRPISVHRMSKRNLDLAANQPSGVLLFLRQFNRKIVRMLSSFRLAIAELVVIAALCGLGTLIEQNKRPDFYIQKYSEDLAFGFLDGEWVLRLCLDHIFSAPYFLGLGGLLAASLVTCSATRQWPLVKIARRWSFCTSVSSISRLQVHDTLPRARLADLGAILAGNKYQVFVQGSSLYAFKGLVGRFAPIGVHAALLLIMGGATVSAIGGYRGSVMVPDGLNFMVGDVMYPQGFLSHPTPAFDTEVHVNSFSIETYADGQVSQYRSDLSLFDRHGKEVSRKVLSVNDPLRYGGFTMYQTDWGISAIQVHVDGAGPFNLVAGPLETGDNKLFGTFFPLGETGLSDAKGISMLARDLQSVVIYDSTGTFVGVRRPGSDRPIKVDGVEIVVDDIIGTTGLELKTRPVWSVNMLRARHLRWCEIDLLVTSSYEQQGDSVPAEAESTWALKSHWFLLLCSQTLCGYKPWLGWSAGNCCNLSLDVSLVDLVCLNLCVHVLLDCCQSLLRYGKELSILRYVYIFFWTVVKYFSDMLKS